MPPTPTQLHGLRKRSFDMTKTKVLLSIDKLDDAFKAFCEDVGRFAQVEVANSTDFDLQGVDILVCKRLSAQQLARADRLKAVFTYKTGVDEIALDELKNRGIILCNSHANSAYIAQYAFTLALAITARVVEFDKNLRKGDWSVDQSWRSLFSMKVGLVGYGSIGREIDKLLRVNGIATCTLNRGRDYEIETADTLLELCDKCDLLILSLPKTAETNDMFNAAVFSHLKGKYIVNVGRGNCIDEEALYQSLKNHEVAGAAIDTWRLKSRGEEKLFPSKKHFELLPNVLLSAHKAMQVADGHAKYVADVANNVIDYISGKSPRNVVDLTKGY